MGIMVYALSWVMQGFAVWRFEEPPHHSVWVLWALRSPDLGVHDDPSARRRMVTVEAFRFWRL